MRSGRNKRTIVEEPVTEDVIRPISTNDAEEGQENGGQGGEPMQEDNENIPPQEYDNIGYLKDSVKRLLVENPTLRIDVTEGEKFKAIDAMNEEQLIMLERNMRFQVGAMLNSGFSDKMIKAIANVIPGVDATRLFDDLKEDTLFQSSFRSVVSMSLCRFSDTLKVAMLLGAHIASNVSTERATKRLRIGYEAPPAPVQVSNNGEEQLRQNNTTTQPAAT